MTMALMAGRAAHAQKIRMTVDGQVVVATLVDNPTTRDFISRLPLTLTLGDYASTEKIVYLDRKLSTAGAPAGATPTVGTIAYYAPWGNLAFYYKDFAYSPGLIPLGRIDSGLVAFKRAGDLNVRIELAD
ncbi:cyclophilin-like fold protein [Oxalobacteraceae bacterium OTU3CINTB1]|nr:cyclophilin-like fold protein [Oxalobacteraceae bacterium OTU3CINTB1]